jgi:hypothetical protein
MVFLIEAAKDVTATQDILNGDAGQGTMPVGTVSGADRAGAEDLHGHREAAAPGAEEGTGDPLPA